MTLAVVFDLDDTLYPERAYNLSGFDAVGEHVLRAHGVSGFGKICRELFLAGTRGDVFDQACRLTGLSVPVPELVAIYREHEPRIALFDDALRVLDALDGRHPLALLTDGWAGVQRRKIAALGIAPRFDSIVVSDEIGGRTAWKPSPEPYKKTVEQLGDRADRHVYIADNPAKDFVTARALGWATVRVDRETAVHREPTAPGHEADHIVHTLDDIPWHRLGEHR